jgi:hypothetical protein
MSPFREGTDKRMLSRPGLAAGSENVKSSYTPREGGRYAGPMAIAKRRHRARDEFAAASPSTERSRASRMRSAPPSRVDDSTQTAGLAADHHGDLPEPDTARQPPREDRAG